MRRHRGDHEIVDLAHVMNVHTPGWVGYAGNKMYYAQNLQTVRIVARRDRYRAVRRHAIRRRDCMSGTVVATGSLFGGACF
jgi:hypothetical protein